MEMGLAHSQPAAYRGGPSQWRRALLVARLSLVAGEEVTEWPNWSGQTAVIIGTGPSAKDAPLDQARGLARAIAIKGAWKLAPWASLLYGLDKGWWLANHGVPDFKGLKVTPSPTAARVFGLRQVSLKARAEILTGETGVLGCGLRTGGGHSGFQAINLAIQFGARKIVLVGFDMTLSNGAHWNSDYRGVSKPDAGRVKSWRVALDGCAEQFKSLGVEVVVVGPSALTAYPKMSLAEALGVRDGAADQVHADQRSLREVYIERPAS
jgi:hypothetical protein